MKKTCAWAWMLPIVVVACQPQPKAVPNQPTTRQYVLRPTSMPATTQSAAQESADALAFRTAQYAKRLEGIARHNAVTRPSTQASVTTQPTTQVAVVPTTQASKPKQIERLSAADLFEKQIQQRMRTNPTDLASQLDYQLLLMLRGAEVPEMGSLSSLSAEDRDTVAALMDCLTKMRASDSNSATISKKIAPITELADRLKSRDQLSVPLVALCAEVTGFGNYAPLDGPLVGGQEHSVVVYCEVANFASNLDDMHDWVTRFTQSMTLFNDKGQSVWQDAPRPIVDRTKTRRHDFFLARVVRLPKTLGAGNYTLKVTILDQHSNRISEGLTSLTIQ